MFIGIRGSIADFPVSVLKADPERTVDLANLPISLHAMSDKQQQRLTNWSYVVCDAGLRSHMADRLKDEEETDLPYPEEALAWPGFRRRR
jgi:NTE family protein